LAKVQEDSNIEPRAGSSPPEGEKSKAEAERRAEVQRKRIERIENDQKAALVLQKFYYLFGRAVFLVLLRGTKELKEKGWEKTTWEQTQEPAYQAKLLEAIKRGGNIAVLHSQGLCAIDGDWEEEWRLFLLDNPELAGRLRTKSPHGGHVFLLMKPGSDYPNQKAYYRINKGGDKVGEWRCGPGAYTVFFGPGYSFEVEEPTRELADFGSIKWRLDWELTWNEEPPDASNPPPGPSIPPASTPTPESGQANVCEGSPPWVPGVNIAALSKQEERDKRKGWYVYPGARKRTTQDNKRIKAYLDKVNFAIDGEGGSNPTYRVANFLVWDCALSRKDALLLLRYYNRTKCKGFWSKKEMEHKVDDAIKETDRRRVRGNFWRETARAHEEESLPGGWEADAKAKKDEKSKAQFDGEKAQKPEPEPEPEPEVNVSGSGLGLVDLVTLAEEADEPQLDLLGNGFLRRGGGMLIIGPTECGKSSLSVQLAVEWSCCLPKAIIKACSSLRVLIVQAEDDRQDSREMARVHHKLGLSAEQTELVRKNTRFVEWCPKGTQSKGEQSAKEDFSESGAELIAFLDEEIGRGGPVDVVIVNPLSAYMDEGVMSQKANRGFFYGWITPFLKRQACAIVFIHHTPKFRDDAKEQHHYVQLYAGAGDATITNWPRASFFIRPKKDGFFEFVPGKRGRRTDWQEEARLFKWGEDCIFWQEASAEEKMDFYVSSSKKGRNPSISAMALERVMRDTREEWVLHADLIHALINAKFSKASAERAIHPVNGYLRKNLLFRGEKRKLQIKWNGFTPEPSP
jgi:hypothetical protein